MPTPFTVFFNSVFILDLSPSFESTENLFGTTLIRQPFSSLMLYISSGVFDSLPGQKGHVWTISGCFFLSREFMKSAGFFLFSFAMITHSRVIRFNLSSGINYLPPAIYLTIYHILTLKCYGWARVWTIGTSERSSS